MPNWKTRVKLNDLHTAFQAGEITIKQVAAELAKRLKDNPYRDDLWVSISDLELLATNTDESPEDLADWYDDILNDLYNFGDEDHRIWFEPS